MKGATSQAITVVIAVIIAASILIFSLKIIGSANQGVTDIQNTGETQQQRLVGAQGLVQSCNDWLTGNKFNAKSILQTYKLPDRLRPYEKAYSACGEDLYKTAQKCFNEQDVTYECAGNGYIKSKEVTTCSNVCLNIKKIFDKCEASCSSTAGQCFENILTDRTSHQLMKDIDVSTREIELACGR